MSRMTEQAPSELKEEGKTGLVSNLNTKHHAVLDLMISNPGISQVKICKELGYSKSWISQLVRSDLFQIEYRRRRKEIEEAQKEELNKIFFEGVKAGAKRLTNMLEEKKEYNEDGIQISGSKDSDAIKATQLMVEAMGVGGGGAKVVVDQSTNVTTNNLEVTSDMLKEARDRRSKIVHGEAEIIEEEKDE